MRHAWNSYPMNRTPGFSSILKARLDFDTTWTTRLDQSICSKQVLYYGVKTQRSKSQRALSELPTASAYHRSRQPQPCYYISPVLASRSCTTSLGRGHFAPLSFSYALSTLSAHSPSQPNDFDTPPPSRHPQRRLWRKRNRDRIGGYQRLQTWHNLAQTLPA